MKVFEVYGAEYLPLMILDYLRKLPPIPPFPETSVEFNLIKEGSKFTIYGQADVEEPDAARDLRFLAMGFAGGVVAARRAAMTCQCPDDRHAHSEGCQNKFDQQIGEPYVCSACRACYESDTAYHPYVPNEAERSQEEERKLLDPNFL